MLPVRFVTWSCTFSVLLGRAGSGVAEATSRSGAAAPDCTTVTALARPP